eukprot:4732538-Prymnesium_polylepis.1
MGLSSFGFSGTIAHGILQMAAGIPTRNLSLFFGVSYQRRVFAWNERQRTVTKGDRLWCVEPISDSGSLQRWEGKPTAAQIKFLGDHQIGYVALLSGSSYTQYACEMARMLKYKACGIVDFFFQAFLFLDEFPFTLAISYNSSTSVLAFHSKTETGGTQKHSELKLLPEPTTTTTELEVERLQQDSIKHVSGEQLYCAVGNNYS